MPGGIGLEGVGDVSDASLAAPENAALDVLRVGLVLRDPRVVRPLGNAVAAAAAAGDVRWERVRGCRAAGDLEAYRNRRVRPVAWLVDQSVVVPPGEAIGSDPGGGTHFPNRPRQCSRARGNGAGRARPECDGRAGAGGVTHATDDELRLTVAADRDAWLVTSEIAYPGWRAEIDGDAAHLTVANGAFRAV